MRKKISNNCNCDIPSIEEQFISIMENFDFKHVHMMMDWDKSRVEYDDDGNHINYNKWKIYHRPKYLTVDFKIDLHVPTIEELKEIAENLLKAAINFYKTNPRCPYYSTATGPFKVTCRYGILELECIFTSWSYD